MKKIKILVALLMVASLTVLTCGAMSHGAKAASVPTSTIEAWKFIGGWSATSSYCEKGVKAVVPGADTVGTGDAWKHTVAIPNAANPSMSLKNNDAVSIRFSIKLYDEDGNVISKSQNSHAVDIKIMNRATGTQLAMVRIWTNSGTNGTDQAFDLYDTGWSNFNNGSWIKGTAKESSSFFLQISKENLIQSYVGGTEELVTLGNEAFQTYFKNAIANVDEIYLDIGGENGFTNSTEITVLEINGQSLANTDGSFQDTVAPTFMDTAVSSSINMGEAFTIPTEAFDLFSSNIQYSLTIGGETIAGKTFTPTAPGSVQVVLNAKDSAGNVATKEYTFHVLSDISAPEIVSLPEILSKELTPYETLTFGKPVFNDVTSTAATVLKIYYGEDKENPMVLTENENHEFTLKVLPGFDAGQYRFVYEITNAGGTTVSDPIVVDYTCEAANSAAFVKGQDASFFADYVETGIRVRGTTNWGWSSFGVFDITHGLDVKYIVPFGDDNSDAFNLRLVNVDDPNYVIMYRVWADGSSADRPTNIYISTNGVDFTDITDTGWISRNVDGVANQYHMLYNPEDTFLGERQGGIQRVDNAYDAVLAFMEAAPSSNFELFFSRASLAGGNYFEYIITEINGQKFASTNGTLNKVEDAYLHADSIGEKVQLNSEVTIHAYSKDIFQDTVLSMTVTKPDGSTFDVAFDNGSAKVLFDTLGSYTLTVSTTGSNGNVVSKEIAVLCKTSVADVQITLPVYESSYDADSEITILDATVSENVVELTITLTKPDGSIETVKVNDTFKLTAPGIYTITYTAKDDAQPEPNTHSESITISVPDLNNPVIEASVAEQGSVGVAMQPTIRVTDESEVDITVTLIKPDSSVSILSKDNSYEFTPDAAGTYTIKVVAEDIYGNREEKRLTVTVAAAEQPSTAGTIYWVVGLVVVLAGAVVAVVIVRKRKMSASEGDQA